MCPMLTHYPSWTATMRLLALVLVSLGGSLFVQVTETTPSGSCIIDMGIALQNDDTDFEPYGSINEPGFSELESASRWASNPRETEVSSAYLMAGRYSIPYHTTKI